MIKPYHQWKKEIVEEDSKKHNVSVYYRWSKQEFYTKYGHYCNDERQREKSKK